MVTSGIPRGAFRVAGIAGGAGLLAFTFRSVDVPEVLRLLRAAGPRAAFLFVPSVAGISLEAVAWREALRVLGVRATLASVVRVRIASESLGSVLPFGAVWADAIKPALLARHCGAPLSAGVVAIAARKYLLLLAQAAYLVIGFAVGRATLTAGFVHAGAPGSFALLAVVAGVVLAFASEGIALSLRGGGTFRALVRAAKKIPSNALRRWLDQRERDTLGTDGAAVRFFRASIGVRALRAAPCLGTWLLEASETWLVLHLLGASLPLGGAVGIEALVVLSRHVLVLLPGGLGAQELGYATLLGGVGVDLGTCAAFTLLKRLREFCFMSLGAWFLVASSPRDRGPTTSALASH